MHLISSRKLEVSDPTSRARKVNVCDADKIVPSDHIMSSIPDELVFGRRGKYINGPRILKEITTIDALLHENFPQVSIRQK